MMAGLVRGLREIGLSSVKASSPAFLKRVGAPAFVRVANAATFGGGLAGGVGVSPRRFESFPLRFSETRIHTPAHLYDAGA